MRHLFLSVLGSVWIVVVREIWNHRNKIIFNSGVVAHLEIFSLAQLNVWTWVTSKVSATQFSFSNWCSLVGFHVWVE